MSEESPEYGTTEMREKEARMRNFDFNQVILAGRLTNNPELRYTPSSVAVCDFQIAVNEYRKDASGETQEETMFIGCTVWAKQAEACSEHLKKGSAVHVTGRLKLDQWEKEGVKRSKHKIRADSVRFLGVKTPPADERDESKHPHY